MLQRFIFPLIFSLYFVPLQGASLDLSNFVGTFEIRQIHGHQSESVGKMTIREDGTASFVLSSPSDMGEGGMNCPYGEARLIRETFLEFYSDLCSISQTYEGQNYEGMMELGFYIKVKGVTSFDEFAATSASRDRVPEEELFPGGPTTWSPYWKETFLKRADDAPLTPSLAKFVDCSSEFKSLDFFMSVGLGDKETVLKMIKCGIDVNKQQLANNPGTPLMVASMYGQEELTKIFLKEGADVNAKFQDTSILTFAAYGGHAGIVRLLIEAGADVNADRDLFFSGLVFASEKGYTDVVRELVKGGADVNAHDGVPALMFASREGHGDIVQILLDAGADVSIVDRNGSAFSPGSTSLLVATRAGHAEIVFALIKAGADINKATNKGATSLMYASASGNKELVKFFLGLGLNVNAEEENGSTALLLASKKGYRDIVQMLLDSGANANGQAGTPYYGYSGIPFLAAMANDHLDVARLIINSGADVNLKDKSGATPLMYLAWNNRVEDIKRLIEEGALVNEKDTSDTTALMSASEKGYLEAVKVLLKAGALVNETNYRGETALAMAKREGHSEVVQVLIEAGALEELPAGL